MQAEDNFREIRDQTFCRRDGKFADFLNFRGDRGHDSVLHRKTFSKSKIYVIS